MEKVLFCCFALKMMDFHGPTQNIIKNFINPQKTQKMLQFDYMIKDRQADGQINR